MGQSARRCTQKIFSEIFSLGASKVKCICTPISCSLLPFLLPHYSGREEATSAFWVPVDSALLQVWCLTNWVRVRLFLDIYDWQNPRESGKARFWHVQQGQLLDSKIGHWSTEKSHLWCPPHKSTRRHTTLGELWVLDP